ncbi:MAG: translocation/assembly module TamB domain-containing protein, partial [Microcystaceae cyanobacterium]
LDKIQVQSFRINLKGNLDKLTLQNISFKPQVGGEIQGRGVLQLNFLNSLKKKRPFNWQKIPINFALTAKLPSQKLLEPYQVLPANTTLGDLQAIAQVTGLLSQPIARLTWQNSTVNQIQQVSLKTQGTAQLIGSTVAIRNALLKTPTGQIQLKALGNFQTDQWQAKFQANQFSLTPWFTVFCRHSRLACPAALTQQPWVLTQAQASVQGKFTQWQPQTLQGNTQFLIRHQSAAIAVQSTLQKGQVRGNIAVNQLLLNPFLTPVKLPTSAPIQLQQLQANFNIPITPQKNWRNLNGNTHLTLNLANTPVNLKATVNQGELTAIAQTRQLNLQKFVPQLPTQTTLKQGKITIIGQLAELLKPQPNLNPFTAIADLQLAVAGGTVTSQTRVNQGEWQSYLTLKRLEPGQLIAASSLGQLNTIQGQALFTGKITPFWQKNQPLAIQVQRANLETGQQFLQAKGQIIFQNLLHHPVLRDLNLQVNSQVNLAKLPTQKALKALPLTPNLRPQSLTLTGLAQFKGQLTGQNIQNLQKLENYQLAGNLNLQNLTFNQVRFEPQLTGKLQWQGQPGLAIKLQGQADQLALRWQPYSTHSYAFLPNYFLINHTYQAQLPFSLEGDRQGDLFQLKIHQFPLALLDLQPGKPYNFPGVLNGELNANLALNLRQRQGQGSLNLNQLGLGYMTAEAIAANFTYQADILQLQQAQLQLGKSRYEMEGQLNLRTLDVQSRLKIAQGKVQDLLTALRISDIPSLLHLWRSPNTNFAKNLPNLSVGNAQAPLQDQVNLLMKIDQEIRRLAARYQRQEYQDALRLPDELNIEGLFDAEVSLLGNLRNPELGMSLRGNHWSWYPQATFVDILSPLGLVLMNTSFLPVEKINLQASLKDGVITVNPSQLEVKEAKISLEGNFSTQQNSAIWQIENLSLDTISTFLKLPGEIAGNLNAQGSIVGSLSQPQLRGSFNFVNVAVNARPVHRAIGGNFNLTDARLQVITDPESPIFFYSAVPLPFLRTESSKVAKTKKNRQENSPDNSFEFRLKAGREALNLMGALTQDQFTVTSGEGEVNLLAKGELKLEQAMTLTNFEAKGNIQLQNVVINSPTLPSPLTLSGNLEFDDRNLKIPALEGQVAQSKLSVSGVLPLFMAQGAIENPLTLTVEKTPLDIPNLYEGEFNGSVVVTGTAFSPELTGNILLANGHLIAPQNSTAPNPASPVQTLKWFKPRQTKPLINPQFKNLTIQLTNLYTEQLPLYSFAFDGQLALNGPLLPLNRIQPQGAIILNRGQINFLDTRFLLDRRVKNQISFSPNQGLFNPNLDIRLRTIVSELPLSKRLQSADTNEIPDDALNQVQRIDISLNIKSTLDQLIPNLNAEQVEACSQPRTLRPLRGDAGISEWRRKRVANCLQILAAKGMTDQQLLQNPGIRLTSSPARSQGQIVRLLGEQFLVLADAVQGGNSSQLLQYGITQLAIPMIFQGTIYDIETSISNVIGTTDIRVVPFLEAVYRVEDKGFVRLSYDYSFNEVKVLYERQF